MTVRHVYYQPEFDDALVSVALVSTPSVGSELTVDNVFNGSNWSYSISGADWTTTSSTATHVTGNLSVMSGVLSASVVAGNWYQIAVTVASAPTTNDSSGGLYQ